MHQLTLQYNVLINTAVLNYVPRDPSTTIEDCDESIGINDNESDDKIEDQLTEIENEMTMLLAVGLKRGRIESTKYLPKPKRKKYDTQKCILPILLQWRGRYPPMSISYGIVITLLI